MPNENQINQTWLAQLASKYTEYNQMLPKHFIDFETFCERYLGTTNCSGCGFPESECDCSRYDSEGNEL